MPERSATLVTPVSAALPAAAENQPLVQLRIMTTNAARLLAVDKQRGAIKAGQFADIIATPENPLANIQTLKRVAFVMKNGQVIKAIKAN